MSILRAINYHIANVKYLCVCGKVKLFFLFPDEIFFSGHLESYHSVIKTLYELYTISHIYSNRHQRSASFWDFMQHTFQDNILVPIFKGQAGCLSFEDGMSRNVGKKLSCIKSQKNAVLIYTMTEA